MNLHDSIKSLEGRYIDLANFYKKEIVKKNPQKLKVGSSATIQKKNIYSLRTQSKDPIGENADDLSQPSDLALKKFLSLDEDQERLKIEAVKADKLRLEAHLKNLIMIQTRITDDSDLRRHFSDPSFSAERVKASIEQA